MTRIADKTFRFGAAEGPMILIHAGAGDSCGETPEQSEQIRVDLKKAVRAGFDALKKTDDASEAVCAAIHVLEDATEFNAGRGAALTEDGKAQMDACLMTGDGDAGSVFGVTCAKHPIDAAKAVKERTKHVCMDNPSEELLDQLGVETVENDYFITDARLEMLAKAKKDGDDWEKHGTVGAVARNSKGIVVAGTSTGGITNQMNGRIGDSPLPGCGTYANNCSAAVSCTGIGEAFIKETAAVQIADRMRFAGQDPAEASRIVLDGVEAHNGDGGVIVMPTHGEAVVAFNSEMMNFAFADDDQAIPFPLEDGLE